MSQYGAFGQTPTTITSSGLGTDVTTNGNVHDITGGTRVGTNLFHSFGEFGVPTNNIANFLNDTGLLTSNILARVTGPNGNNPTLSSIDGTIQTTGFSNANLFLLNPAGFLFGPNATLNVSGSVAFTTANYLRLAETNGSNAGIFHANLAKTSILTAAPVAAFGFLVPNAASIDIQGSQLSVPDGQTLDLIGGDIQIESGNLPDDSIQPSYLTAPGGKIHIASVATAGEILVDTLQTAPNIEGQSFSQFGATSIREGSTLDVSGESSGTVRIRSGQFTMDNGFLFAGSFGDVDKTGNAVSIDVTNNVLIGNQSLLDATSFGMGRTGDIEIRANNLSLTEGSIIAAQGFGGAEAGNISLTIGNTFSISGTDSFGNGSLITTSGPGTGTGGAVTVKASDMIIADQGTIRAEGGAEFAGGITLEVQSLTLSTGGSIQAFGGDLGPSGNVKIVATDSISLNGNGDFSARIMSVNVGAGGTGTIAIETGTLTLSNSAQILSETALSPGGTDVPKLSITADSVSVSGGSRIDITTLQGDVGALEISAQSVTLSDQGLIRSTTTSGGNSGSIDITADNMTLSGGSQINSSTEGINVTGQGGDISLTVTEKLALAGSFTDASGAVTPTAIQSNTQFGSLGDAGQISIAAGTVDISNGALIASRSASGATGNAGNITIQRLASPADSIVINGPSSGIFTDAQGTGAGGDITIQTKTLTIQNGGTISAATSGLDEAAIGGDVTVNASQAVNLRNNASISARSTGTADAGNITINAGNRFEARDSSVTTKSEHAGGGNIEINARDRFRLVNSQVNASAFLDGGNITIDPRLVLLQNSQILAQSIHGNGGNITITTPLFLSDQSSFVSASSQFGLNGTVTIQSPTSNLSGSLGPLASKPSQAQSLLTQRCAALANGQASSFVVAGREQLPSDPGSWLSSPLYAAAMGLGVTAEGVQAEGERLGTGEGITAYDTDTVSLRRLTPARFLMANFADSEATGCHS